MPKTSTVADPEVFVFANDDCAAPLREARDALDFVYQFFQVLTAAEPEQNPLNEATCRFMLGAIDPVRERLTVAIRRLDMPELTVLVPDDRSGTDEALRLFRERKQREADGGVR